LTDPGSGKFLQKFNEITKTFYSSSVESFRFENFDKKSVELVVDLLKRSDAVRVKKLSFDSSDCSNLDIEDFENLGSLHFCADTVVNVAPRPSA
jgi:hypothetical protein